MDVPASAAGPWVALGAVLGALLLLAVGAAVLRLGAGTPPAAPGRTGPGTDEPRDDLADFLASPPGTPGARDEPGDGWVPLAVAAGPPAGPDRSRERTPGARPGAALAGVAAVALVLVGVAAALAVAARAPVTAPDPGPAAAMPTTSTPSTSADDGRAGVTARLAFDGVVLEEHAVGITAAYPELELAVDGAESTARLRLPAVNCLATSAPPAPGDPACRTARTEFAELSSPDLRVVRDGDELTVSGRFATVRRPPGAAAEPTGRSYELSVSLVVPEGGRSAGAPADARLRWEGREVPARADEVRPGG